VIRTFEGDIDIQIKSPTFPVTLHSWLQRYKRKVRGVVFKKQDQTVVAPPSSNPA